MKKLISMIIVLLFITAAVFAQAPPKMSYQAIIRNNLNILVTNTTVGMRISILQGTPTGTVVYQETQTPTTDANGLVSLVIGDGVVVSGSIPAINWATGPYYIKTETDPAGGTSYTVTGTSQLLSVPYALFAANTSFSGSGTLNFIPKWTPNGSTLGNSIMFDNSNSIGVGTITPVAKVEIRGFNPANNLFTSSTGFSGATGLGVRDITAQPTNEKWGIHTFVNGAIGTQHAIFTEPGTTAAINTGLFGRVSTAPAGGQSFGLFAFDAVNNASTWAATIRGRLQYQDGTQANDFILRSDINGNANWVDPSILIPGGNLWTRVGTNLWNTNLGDNVGVGTLAPAYRLDVEHGGATGIRSKSTGTFSVIDIDGSNGDAALRFQRAGVNQWNTRNNPATDDYQIFELGGGGERFQIQDGSGNVGIGGISPAYRLDVQHGGATGVHVVSTGTFSVVDIDGSNGDAALRFQRAGVNQWNTRNNPATDDYQIFELGGGGERMRIDNTTGHVWVNNDFDVLGAKNFAMDHPLDPENKILRHAAAESNEVINFYSGNITTDASGKATVKLPDYFESINKDFRYTLTVVGIFAQAIISKEVSNNKFEIATSVPNVKVSWEVKGVRNDARFQKFPYVSEEVKSPAQKGKYLDPVAHNQPASKGLSYDANLQSSLDDVKTVQKKAAPATTGGSLDQMPVQKVTKKPVDNDGSVKQTAADKITRKPVDNDGSVKQTTADKVTAKPVDNSGSAADVPPVKKEN